MKLETTNGSLFSLTVEKYEFPNEELGPTIDNPADEFDTGRFLVVSHTLRNTEGEWYACGPTMTTTELQRLMDWLKSLNDRNPSSELIYFTERDLEFSINQEVTILSVHVFRNFLPPWSNSNKHMACVTIDFELQQLDLDLAITSLLRQLTEFPGRPPISTAT